MLGPNGIFSERHRGKWLLACGSSWMLLFVYGTLKFLWMHEWGFACVTGGVIALGPASVALTLSSRARRERVAAERAALEAALEAQLDHTGRTRPASPSPPRAGVPASSVIPP